MPEPWPVHPESSANTAHARGCIARVSAATPIIIPNCLPACPARGGRPLGNFYHTQGRGYCHTSPKIFATHRGKAPLTHALKIFATHRVWLAHPPAREYGPRKLLPHTEKRAHTHAWPPEKTYHTQGRVSAFAARTGHEKILSLASPQPRGAYPKGPSPGSRSSVALWRGRFPPGTKSRGPDHLTTQPNRQYSPNLRGIHPTILPAERKPGVAVGHISGGSEVMGDAFSHSNY